MKLSDAVKGWGVFLFRSEHEFVMVDFPIDDKAYQVNSWQRPEMRGLLLDRKFYWS
jgi:hypothetical protein